MQLSCEQRNGLFKFNVANCKRYAHYIYSCWVEVWTSRNFFRNEIILVNALGLFMF